MDFVVWLALYRPSGRPISARTIRKYVSSVRAWHLRTYRTALCGDLDYSAVNDLLRGITRLIAQPPPRERWGVRTQDLARALELYLSKRTVESSNWAAALVVAFCGLLRGTEFALEPGERFNPYMEGGLHQVRCASPTIWWGWCGSSGRPTPHQHREPHHLVGLVRLSSCYL